MTQVSRKGFVDKNGRKVVIVPKVPGATSGNLATFDAGGNLQDSGKKAGDFVPKVPGATSGNLATFDAGGNLQDSGYKPSDFAPTIHTHTSLVNRIKELEYIVGLGWKLLEESYEFSGSNTSSPVHNYPITGEPDGIILPQDSYNLISVGDSVRLVPKPAGITIEFTVTGKGSGPYFITTDTDTKIISGTFDIYTKKASSES